MPEKKNDYRTNFSNIIKLDERFSSEKKGYKTTHNPSDPLLILNNAVVFQLEMMLHVN